MYACMYVCMYVYIYGKPSFTHHPEVMTIFIRVGFQPRMVSAVTVFRKKETAAGGWWRHSNHSNFECVFLMFDDQR